MKVEDETAKLKATIAILEKIKVLEETQLKTQFKNSLESLQPLKLVKNSFEKLANQPEFKADLIDTSLSLITGYLSKRFLFGSSKSPIKKAFGNLMQMGVTAVTAKYFEDLREFTSAFFSSLGSKEDDPKEEEISKEEEKTR